VQLLKEDEPEKFQSHFSGFIKEGIEADDLAEMYTKVHAAIRADPAQQKTEKKAPAEPKRYIHVDLLLYCNCLGHSILNLSLLSVPTD
jgi:hypothetical protein